MNNKIISIKRSRAIFLATVLIAGTIALSSPSFMTNVSAQSESYYGMDNNNYKSQYGQDKYKTKDNVIVKKINCNNINVNINGLELDGLPTALRGLLTGGEADNEGQYGPSSYGSDSGGQSSYDNNSFKFVCVNNNNNTVVVVGEEPPAPVPPVEGECPEAEIESCFRQFLNDAIFLLTGSLEFGLTVEINGEEVTLRSFEDICEALEGLTTFGQLQIAVGDILEEANIFNPMNPEFFSCIANALDIPIPPR